MYLSQSTHARLDPPLHLAARRGGAEGLQVRCGWGGGRFAGLMQKKGLAGKYAFVMWSTLGVMLARAAGASAAGEGR